MQLKFSKQINEDFHSFHKNKSPNDYCMELNVALILAFKNTNGLAYR